CLVGLTTIPKVSCCFDTQSESSVEATKKVLSNQQKEFYEATQIVLEGLCDFSDRYAAEAERLANTTEDKKRQEELIEIAQICRNVPRKPANSFREAIQSVWFVHMSIRIEGTGLCIGRPDQFLYPYYRKDKDAGKFLSCFDTNSESSVETRRQLTDEAALELLEMYLIKLNEFGTRPQGCMVGGVLASGNDATNELSYRCLRAMHNLRMVNPSLAIDWYECTPDDLLRYGCKMLSEGVSHPAIFNGEVIVPGLVDGGLAIEDARNHIHSTCIEMTPIGKSNIWVAHGYVNLAKALELVLHNGIDPLSGQQVGPQTGELSELSSLPELFIAWRKQMAKMVADNAQARYNSRLHLAEHSGSPLISCFVHDCLERGRDVVAGGALYNNIYPQGVGLVNVADSMMVIKKFVYDAKQLTLAELVEMCDKNFAGYEDWRQRFMNRAPKYGNDSPETDNLALDVAQAWYDEVMSHEAPMGGRFRPGFLSWIQHGVLGTQTGATPDGRLSRTALADSLSAAQGRDKNGPTAMIKSATKIDYRPANGGMVLNLKFSPSAVRGEEGIENLMQLLLSYLRMGGFEAQVNVISADMLRDAREHPENYRNLVVRVAGFSEYFTSLSREIQNEIIERTELSNF
ncbi:MAG: pyruvate formate lyase family protein, partial [Calditrichota bacterium]